MFCDKSVILESKDCSHRCFQVYIFIFQASHYRNQQNLENAFKEVMDMESVQKNFTLPHTTMNITRPHVTDKYGCKGSEEGRGRTSPWHVQVSVLGLLELQLYCLCLQLRVCDFLRLFVIVGTWWQLCYPNETLRGHMARKVFTIF